MTRPAIFLDRDGTLMAEVDYCSDPADVALFPGVPEALAALKAAGYLLIIVTNQSGIGRGYFTVADYEAVHTELLRQIGPSLIDATYYCPDAPPHPSPRRKPEPGMVREAAAAHGIDLHASWFVGDKQVDIQCGRRAGTRTLLVRTGYGGKEGAGTSATPDLIADDFPAATRLILAHR